MTVAAPAKPEPLLGTLPLRVLMLNDAVFDDAAGGGRLVAKELARVLASRGHEVTFLVPRQGPVGTPDDERTAAGVRVVRYAGAGKGAAFVREGEAACARLLASETFDVVHTHFAYAASGPLRAVARRLGRGALLPHVRSFYGPWDAEGFVEDNDAALRAKGIKRPLLTARAHAKRAVRHRIEQRNVTRSDVVLVLSEHSRGEAVQYGCAPEAVRFAPGGADLARFHPGAGRAAARRALGLPGDRPILFTVRRLVPRMGLENLVAAMSAITAQFGDALLLIGGRGPQKEALEASIRERGLADRVRLVGFIPDIQLPDYYRAADLFVLPTVALEGFGLITVEALASGTPVIGTPVGATPEILSGLEPRLLTKGTDPESLADAVTGYLAARRDGAAWATDLTPERLSTYVAERYTWERHADVAEAAYREAIFAPKKSGAKKGGTP